MMYTKCLEYFRYSVMVSITIINQLLRYKTKDSKGKLKGTKEEGMQRIIINKESLSQKVSRKPYPINVPERVAKI